MSIEKSIKEKLLTKFSPIFLLVENESHLHSVPENSETHFKILLASDSFKDLGRVERHQLVYSVLGEELKNKVHALSQRVYSLDEWEKIKDNYNFASPLCSGAKRK